ncbi:MAG: transporter substrate-binding domain-containing protein [Gammaproteobacteria bacterium]|nr:transporter substrate-binding domain-containing protein [Gammaproteobacteria bacterium]
MRISRLSHTLFALCALSFAAQAEKLSVGVETTEYPPHYSTADGQYSGFARAVLDAFAKKHGHEFEYRAMPVARLLDAFIRGDVDLKYPDNEMWQGDAKQGKGVVYSKPVVAYTDGVLVLPENKGAGVDKLATISMMRGFTPWEFLDRIKAGKMSTLDANSFDAVLLMAVNKRTSGAYSNVAVAQYMLDVKLKTPGALVFDDGLPHTNSNYHLSSIKRPEIISQFDTFLAEEKAQIDQLKKEYKVE